MSRLVNVVESVVLQLHGSRQIVDEAAQAAQTARLLSGQVPDLALGERVKVTVLKATPETTLLDVKGIAVQGGPMPGLEAGAEVYVRVTALSPQPILQRETEPTPPPAGELPTLEVGASVSARVLDWQPETGRIRLEVHGVPVEANIPEGLPRSDRLTLRVAETQPQVAFDIVETPPHDLVRSQVVQLVREQLSTLRADGPQLNALRQALGDLGETGLGKTGLIPAGLDPLTIAGDLEKTAPTLARLRSFLRTLVSQEGPPLAERIEAFVRDGGLQYEAKLARALRGRPDDLQGVADRDLKGLLLQSLGEVESHPSEPIAAPLRAQLSYIETQQAVNLLAQVQGEPYLFQVPYFDGHNLRTALLSVEPDERGGRQAGAGRQGGHRLLFLLDLDNVGKTQIDAYLDTQTIRVIFYLERPEAVKRFQDALPTFRESLRSAGYQDVLLAAQPLQQVSPEKRERFAALAAGIPTSISLIDTRA